jgi:hypothetical protein
VSAELGGITNTVEFTVELPPPSLTSLAVSPVDATNLIGTTRRFSATGTYSDGSTQDLSTAVTWASSDLAVAGIDTNGLVTAVAPGLSLIFAEFDGLTNSVQLIVALPPPSLTSLAVSPVNATNLVGTIRFFIATGTYSDGSTQDLTTAVTWVSSDLPIVTIDTNGLATTLSQGTALISAELGGITNTIQFTIELPPPTLISLAVSPVSSTNYVGTTRLLSATGTYSDGATQDLATAVTWVSADTAVATIDTNGLVTALGSGTSLISAEFAGITNSMEFTVLPPVTHPLLTLVARVSGNFQFSFTNSPGASFTVWATTNLGVPLSEWENVGAPTEISAGQYQFSDPQAAEYSQRFYKVRQQ